MKTTIRTAIQGQIATAQFHIGQADEMCDDMLRANVESGRGLSRDPGEDEEGDPSSLSYAIRDLELALEQLHLARDANNERPGAEVRVPAKDIINRSAGEDGPGTPLHAVRQREDNLSSLLACRVLLTDLAEALPPSDAKEAITFALEWKAQHSHEKYDLQATLDMLTRSLVVDLEFPADATSVCYRAAAVVLERAKPVGEPRPVEEVE